MSVLDKNLLLAYLANEPCHHHPSCHLVVVVKVQEQCFSMVVIVVKLECYYQYSQQPGELLVQVAGMAVEVQHFSFLPCVPGAPPPPWRDQCCPSAPLSEKQEPESSAEKIVVANLNGGNKA